MPDPAPTSTTVLPAKSAWKGQWFGGLAEVVAVVVGEGVVVEAPNLTDSQTRPRLRTTHRVLGDGRPVRAGAHIVLQHVLLVLEHAIVC